MGIKDLVIRAGGKAADAVAKVSSLSAEQLEEVQAKREAYLFEMPDPGDGAAEEQTARLLAACGVEAHNAYLSQIRSLYVPVEPGAEYGSGFDSAHNIRFVNITRWVADSEEKGLEKLVNVYDVLADELCNIALVFHRSATETRVYLAVVNTRNDNNNSAARDYATRLANAVKGNFPGSELSGGGAGRIPCLDNDLSYSIAAVSNIPAEKSEGFISQTIEKILDGIVPVRRSQEYTIVLLATPVGDIEERKMRLAELHTGLAPYASWQTNYTYTESDSTMSMATVGVNVGVNAGVQSGVNSAQTVSDGVTDSSNDSVSESTGESVTDTSGRSVTDSESSNASHSVGTNESSGVSGGGGVGASIDLGTVEVNASGSAQTFTSHGSSVSDTIGRGVSHAVSESTSRAVGKTAGRAVGRTLGRAVSSTVGNTVGAFASTSLGGNFGMSFARASSVTATIGKNEGITQSFSNYAIKHTLEKLEQQMARLEQGTALGMWDFAAYVLSEDYNVANNVAHSYLSHTQGEESHLSHAAVNLWRGDRGDASGDARAICGYLRDFRHPLFAINPHVLEEDVRYAVYPCVVDASTSLSGKELAYSLNFPRRSVSGFPVFECAEFGRNVVTYDGGFGSGEGRRFGIGSIFHMHCVEPTRVALDSSSLASHVFVTGSTGSGKSNTVYRLLEEAIDAGVGFLVIEPAKGEYKDVFGMDEDVAVFGTNPYATPLLRINPFSFPEGIHVLEHIDRLIEIFNVCWPMYAAMPAVLKDAVERAYADCGWDLATSRNEFGSDYFPAFTDVARNVGQIIDSSEYDAENKGAYKGSLLTRLNSLSNGINGLVFCDDGISDGDLFDGKVIVDLSRVGSAETKSLLMGLLVLKLQEHRMLRDSASNGALRHLTVIEEAHNLLRRSSVDQSAEGANLVGKSVEMLANAIAEMRAYGEGFVVADQAPGLLDMAVVRNTNTKIIMRLPAQSDRELVGRAANLNDAQIEELARLPRGVAAIYQNEWIQPVLCKVDKADAGYGAFEYERPPVDGCKNRDDALYLANLLASGGVMDEQVDMGAVAEAMARLKLGSFVRVSIAELLRNPPEEPRMTKLAPLMTALFPGVRDAVAGSRARSAEPREWTRAAESALRDLAGDHVGDLTRRVVVQGVVTEYLLHELGDSSAFEDWYVKGGLR